MFAFELARRENEYAKTAKCPPVTSNSLHPGLVRTDVVRNMPLLLKVGNMMFGFVLSTLQKVPRAGAYTSVYCASSSKLNQVTGLYYSNSEAVMCSNIAYDEKVRFKAS